MSNLYHVLGELSGYNPYFLRHMVANYMIKNPSFGGESLEVLLKAELNTTLEDYVSKLRKSDTNFSCYEIKAYCNCLSRNVTLYTQNANPILFSSPKESYKHDKICFSAGKYSKKII